MEARFPGMPENRVEDDYEAEDFRGITKIALLFGFGVIYAPLVALVAFAFPVEDTPKVLAAGVLLYLAGLAAYVGLEARRAHH